MYTIKVIVLRYIYYDTHEFLTLFFECLFSM